MKPRASGGRKAMDVMVKVLSTIASFIGIIFLAWILLVVLKRGLSAFDLAFFTQGATPAGVEGGGMANAILGTALINRHRLLLGSEPYAPIVYEKGRQIVTYLVGEIQERLSESSLEGGRKVCVILSADRLNARTANALLKTLEEPPEGVHFILTSERVSSVLPTIVSRASVLRFRRLRVSEITEWLGRYPELTAEKRLSCAHLGEGSIKAAKAFAFEHREDIRSLSRDLYEKTALGEADTVVTNAASFLGSRDVLDAEELITGFTLLTRSVMECKCGFITEDAGQAEVIQRLADSTNIDALVRLAAQLEKGLEMLNRNVNISMIMTKLLYEIHDTYR